MSQTHALRLRLIATYVAVLFAGLLVFATAAVFAIDRSERNGLDARLSAAAQALSALIDLRTGRVTIDKDDRRQFLTALGSQTSGVVIDASDSVVLSNVATPPADVVSLPATTATFASAGEGDAELRVFVRPIWHNGGLVGRIVVWRPSAWIEETDRQAGLAFLIAALLIAGLAWVTGGAVTHRALEDAFARQRRFTADASHELRAPLAVIRAETDLALRKDREPAGYRETLAAIAGETERMERLLGDLLSVARADAGALEQKPIDLNALVREVCTRFAAAAAAKDIRLTFIDTPGAQAAADAAGLERALVAVIHNAVKYAPAAGHIDVRIQNADGLVEVAVRNDGPPFSDDALQHALERFWRDDAAAGTGTGLGLTLADAILRAFDGRVQLANVDGRAETRLILRAG